MKAKIFKDTKNPKALWLYVTRNPQGSDMLESIQSIMGMRRTEGDEENTAYAILPDEVEAIRDACNEWLEKK